MMLERPGDIVTREEIRARLWPDGTTVDFEHSVNAAVKRLRAALGDAAEHPRYVETLPRRGYRFIAMLEDAYSASTAPKHRQAPAQRPRLVALPFANLSDDPSQDYFSDGLTEEMIAQLGRRCGSRIGVLARTSSMLYKNASRGAGDIGEALRADYLVEGSVRREGDRVRITAQLIETGGETHVWAESYDRQLADCLAVQMEVASEIAHALSYELLPTASARRRERGTPGPTRRT
jgi:TolB-like protein